MVAKAYARNVLPKRHHIDRRASKIATDIDGDNDALVSTRALADQLGISTQWLEIGAAPRRWSRNSCSHRVVSGIGGATSARGSRSAATCRPPSITIGADRSKRGDRECVAPLRWRAEKS